MIETQTAARPSPLHHPEDSWLMDYASGATNEAEALILAAHLTLCPSCRAAVAELEGLGGAMMDRLTPVKMDTGALQTAWTLIDMSTAPDAHQSDGGPMPEGGSTSEIGPSDDLAAFPAPLRRYVGGDADRLRWQPVKRGLDECELDVGSGEVRTRVLRLAAGAAVPRHTHKGNEMTLVLTGGFADNRGHFVRGDLVINDSTVEHRPVADSDGDCICLVVTDGPMRLTGIVGRFLNPFVG